jgi:4-amino-4-deoxy-L-arabinose transferase-like glycosyltransferase
MSSSRALLTQPSVTSLGERRWTMAVWSVAAVLSLLLLTLAVPRLYRFGDHTAWNSVGNDASHFTYLLTRAPRGWPLVIGVCLFITAAGGLGRVLARIVIRVSLAGTESALVSIGLGLMAYTYLFMAAGWAQLLRAPVVAAMIGIGLLCAVLQCRSVIQFRSVIASFRRVSVHRPPVGTSLLAVAIAISLYLGLVAALGPEVQFDARWYHLAIPEHYAMRGGFFDIVRDTHLTAAGLTPYQEMLYSGLAALLGPIGAKLLHWADAVLATTMLIYLGREYFASLNIGLLAALIFVSTPQIAWSSATGSNDLPQTVFGLLIVHCFLRWRVDHNNTWLLLGGLFGGYAIGVKPVGAFTLAVFMLGVVVTLLCKHQSRRVIRTAIIGAGILCVALAACLPWMMHAYRLTGDPVFPALYGVFHTPYWNAQTDAYSRAIPGLYGADWSLRGLLTLPWQLTVHGPHYRTLLGPSFLASLPLVGGTLLLVRGTTATTYRWLAAFFLAWTILWFGSGLLVLRYAEILVPIAALLIAVPVIGTINLVGPWVPVRMLWLLMLISALALNSQLLLPLQRHSDEPLVEARSWFSWNYLYAGQSEREALNTVPAIIWYMNDTLTAPGTKVFDGCALIPYYLYSRVELFNGWHYDSPAHIEGWDLTSPDAVVRLQHAKVTHVVVCADQEAQLRNTALWARLTPHAIPAGSYQLLFTVSSAVVTSDAETPTLPVGIGPNEEPRSQRSITSKGLRYRWR